jgi:hypothetical protein
MNTQQLVSMLKQQLARLEQDALIHDQNLAPSQRQSLQEIERFNSQLFAQQGAQHNYEKTSNNWKSNFVLSWVAMLSNSAVIVFKTDLVRYAEHC